MQLDGQRESDNVEDVRGRGPGRGVVVGGGVGTVVIVVLAMLFGFDPSGLLRNATRSGAPPAVQRTAAGNDSQKHFVSKILASTEDVWTNLMQRSGRTYRTPHLVLFTDEVQSACGLAGSAVGPFYCPGDEKVYLDLGFYDELQNRFHAPGDFAQAYVIAHEIGHHVQKILGRSDKVDEQRRHLSKEEFNKVSVRLELQADFYAGVWGFYAQKKGLLEAGDVEEALNAASAIGDDRLQRQARGYVVPDSFTHGTSAQRVRWFRRGFQTGDPRQGDTFNARDL